MQDRACTSQAIIVINQQCLKFSRKMDPSSFMDTTEFPGYQKLSQYRIESQNLNPNPQTTVLAQNTSLRREKHLLMAMRISETVQHANLRFIFQQIHYKLDLLICLRSPHRPQSNPSPFHPVSFKLIAGTIPPISTLDYYT